MEMLSSPSVLTTGLADVDLAPSGAAETEPGTFKKPVPHVTKVDLRNPRRCIPNLLFWNVAVCCRFYVSSLLETLQEACSRGRKVASRRAPKPGENIRLVYERQHGAAEQQPKRISLCPLRLYSDHAGAHSHAPLQQTSSTLS
jgi:hypothetical protein